MNESVSRAVFDHEAFAASDPLSGQDLETPVLRIELVSAREMLAHHAAWQNLADRALEPNVFLEPAFALPLIQHASARRPDFLLVWQENGPTTFGRLIGLLPILPSAPLMRPIVAGFCDVQIRLGTPLIDRDRGGVAIDAMLDWLMRHRPHAGALRLCALAADNAFVKLLGERCALTGRRLRHFRAHRRAVLCRTPEGLPPIKPLCQSKRRKELGRQRRRLSERGVRTYASATTPDAIARATERFLALEHNGWKGARGTALLAMPALATFTRSMTRLMGCEGKCRIDAIEIDGTPVAMGIVLMVGDRAHYWKTTFHEAFAPLSPGVQFTLELTDRQLADPKVALTDSCAVADHSMIDRLWTERLAITDLLIELQPTRPALFLHACRVESTAQALRSIAKAIYNRLARAVRRD